MPCTSGRKLRHRAPCGTGIVEKEAPARAAELHQNISERHSMTNPSIAASNLVRVYPATNPTGAALIWVHGGFAQDTVRRFLDRMEQL